MSAYRPVSLKKMTINPSIAHLSQIVNQLMAEVKRNQVLAGPNIQIQKTPMGVVISAAPQQVQQAPAPDREGDLRFS